MPGQAAMARLAAWAEITAADRTRLESPGFPPGRRVTSPPGTEGLATAITLPPQPEALGGGGVPDIRSAGARALPAGGRSDREMSARVGSATCATGDVRHCRCECDACVPRNGIGRWPWRWTSMRQRRCHQRARAGGPACRRPSAGTTPTGGGDRVTCRPPRWWPCAPGPVDVTGYAAYLQRVLHQRAGGGQLSTRTTSTTRNRASASTSHRAPAAVGQLWPRLRHYD